MIPDNQEIDEMWAKYIEMSLESPEILVPVLVRTAFRTGWKRQMPTATKGSSFVDGPLGTLASNQKPCD